ncbi:MAG: AMP-binding protein [Clostridia bacterium]|nr:AMP-binding protein [Clostridia bacterium]
MKDIPLYEVRPIRSLKDMLNSSTELYSSKAAFLVKDKPGGSYLPVTYKKFKDDVDALGTALLSLGLKGERIIVIGEGRYEWAMSYLTVVNGVGVIVPLDRELPQNEIENLIRRSKASAIIYSGHLKENILNFIPTVDSIKHFIHMDAAEDSNGILSFRQLLSKGYQLVSSGERSFIDADIDVEAMSMLLFTSGTTELSKAVMLSHRNICSNLMSMSSMLYIASSDIFLSVLPIHHTYECTCGLLCPIYRGATVAYSEGLRHILQNMQESKATIMLAVPLIYEAMYKRIWDQASKKPGMIRKLRLALKASNALRSVKIDLTKKLFAPIHQNLGGSMRLFISGAAGIDPEVAKGFRSFGIHFVQGYGLTECSPIVALNRDVDFKDNAAGLPLPNLEVRIDHPGNDGVGEIAVKGPSVMMGYYENPEATQKVLKDGWFYTGDAGYMDDSKFVYITGRKKNVIVTKNGKNIYPEEIETILNRSVYIKESLVYGKEDEESADVVVSAIIVPDYEKLQEDYKDTELTSEKIRGILQEEIKLFNKSLVIYKHIKYFHLKDDEFEKTTTKKIKRYLEKKV